MLKDWSTDTLIYHLHFKFLASLRSVNNKAPQRQAKYCLFNQKKFFFNWLSLPGFLVLASESQCKDSNTTTIKVWWKIKKGWGHANGCNQYLPFVAISTFRFLQCFDIAWPMAINPQSFSSRINGGIKLREPAYQVYLKKMPPNKVWLLSLTGLLQVVACIISATDPDKPGSLCLIFFNAAATSSIVMQSAGSSSTPANILWSHSFSSSIRCSMYSFHESIIPFSSRITLLDTSFTWPQLLTIQVAKRNSLKKLGQVL